MLDAPASPPMGWNSWDCYGTTVTEAEVLANADVMADRLLRFGWNTVVVDIDWSDPTAQSHGYNDSAPLEMDRWGRLMPDPRRFPSAIGGAGFAPLASAIHSRGLKFGIHTMRGIPRLAVEQNTPILGTSFRAADIADPTNVCEWNPDMIGLKQHHPGSQAYYDSTLQLYAHWGVDFIKSDDMLWPYQAADIEAYARAINGVDRRITLSLSPGRDLSLSRLGHLRTHASMWRICDDLWDRWEDVEANFARFARWAPYAGPEGWPDGDMLPLGRVGLRAERGEPRDDKLTPAERITLMTLWIIARSPLMIGGDLPSTSPETLALFTNPDAMAVPPALTGSRELFREGDLVIWGGSTAGEQRYAAVFHLGDAPADITLDVRNVGFDTAPGEIRELWGGTVPQAVPVRIQSDDARGVAPGSCAVRLTLPPHGAALLRYIPDAGPVGA